MLRHDDLPTVTEGEELTAWQAAHEPVVTVRVWLGQGGLTMTHVGWASEIAAIGVTEEMPLVEMATVIAALHGASHKLQRVIEAGMADAVAETAGAES